MKGVLQVGHEGIARAERHRSAEQVEGDLDQVITRSGHHEVCITDRSLDLLQIAAVIGEIEAAKPLSSRLLATLVFEVGDRTRSTRPFENRVRVTCQHAESEVDLRMQTTKPLRHHEQRGIVARILDPVGSREDNDRERDGHRPGSIENAGRPHCLIRVRNSGT